MSHPDLPDWNTRYQKGDTPWEKGSAHPALPFFVSQHQELFKKSPRLFHPGCGYGRDAAYLAQFCGEITALDIAEQPIAEAQALYPAENIRWEAGDLFSWSEPEDYDLAWEHTCFCAIPLSKREDYVRAIHGLLKPGGFLLAVFFLKPDHALEEGPPFGVTREELRRFFGEQFELIEDLPNPETYPGRENRETLMIWQKRK